VIGSRRLRQTSGEGIAGSHLGRWDQTNALGGIMTSASSAEIPLEQKSSLAHGRMHGTGSIAPPSRSKCFQGATYPMVLVEAVGVATGVPSWTESQIGIVGSPDKSCWAGIRS